MNFMNLVDVGHVSLSVRFLSCAKKNHLTESKSIECKFSNHCAVHCVIIHYVIMHGVMMVFSKAGHFLY